MARPKVREVSAPSAIQGIATPVNTYVRPPDPAPSPLHELAQGLAAFDAGIGKLLNKRQQEKDADDFERGRMQAIREIGPGLEEGVRQGSIPPQASPRFMEGLRTGQGNLAGMRLRNQFRREFLQWDGREKGDDAAYGQFLQTFITKNVPADSDPDFLRGLNPHIDRLLEDGYQTFSTDTASALYGEGLKTDSASLTEVIRTQEEEGQTDIDYEAIWATTLAIRNEALKRGTRHADIDTYLVDTIILNAERTKDEGLLAILDRTIPGEEHPMSFGLDIQKKRDAAAERIANGKAKDESDNARAREQAEKKRAGQIYAEVATVWSQDLDAEIPESLIEDLSRIDPMARSTLADLKKKLADADGIEDKAAVARIFADIHEGTATKRDVMDHFQRGTIRSTETLNQALDRVDRMEKERREGTGILSDATLRKWHTLIESMTGSDPTNPFTGAGLTDEGLEAVHDMNRMVLDWEEKNPEASFMDRQEAINRIGLTIRQRIQLDPMKTTGGRYEAPQQPHEDQPAQPTAQQTIQTAAPQAVTPQQPKAAPQAAPAPEPQDGGFLDMIPNPIRSAGEWIETVFGSGDEGQSANEMGTPQPPSTQRQPIEIPPLESLPEDQREAINTLAERHGVDPETAQRDIWSKVQELIDREAEEGAPSEPGTNIDSTTTNAIPEDIKGDLSSLYEHPPQVQEASLATAYVNPKDNPSVAVEVLDRFAGKRLPVSLRNNNMGAISITGNIEASWAAKQPGFVGTTKRPASEGGHYAKFATPEHGVAAASRLLESYGKQGVDTPESIVKKWSADASAHDAYAKTLVAYLDKEGIEADTTTALDLSKPEVRIAVLKAITAHESGAGIPAYSDEVFERGANYRVGNPKPTKGRGMADLIASSKRGYQPDLENLQPTIRQGVSDLQKAWGRPLPIVSGYRDPQRNQKAGGAKKSQHMHGNAVDIDVADLSNEERVELIRLASEQGFKGIGVYANSIHLDHGERRYWGPSHGAKSLPSWAKAAIKEHMSRKA